SELFASAPPPEASRTSHGQTERTAGKIRFVEIVIGPPLAGELNAAMATEVDAKAAATVPSATAQRTRRTGGRSLRWRRRQPIELLRCSLAFFPAPDPQQT